MVLSLSIKLSTRILDTILVMGLVASFPKLATTRRITRMT
jgi:hypothetical protein